MSACDLAVCIGRFQPFHQGHLAVVRAGLAQAGRLLIILCSEDAARRPDLVPFTAREREAMILAALPAADHGRVAFRAVPDFGDPTLWSEAVQRTAAQVAGAGDRIALVGGLKARTGHGLDALPPWPFIAVASDDGACASDIRRAYFDDDPASVDAFLSGPARAQAPEGVVRWLQAFRADPAYADMVEEWAFARRYREAWKAAPYPPVFVTADSVVIQDGHVLLIRRRNRPGRGLWALPGGFLEQHETVFEAALRELEEETGLKVPDATLRRSHLASRVFDAPERDIRGRIITHAALFHLPPRGDGFPEVVADDDADAAVWVPLPSLRRDRMFGDHFIVIQTLTGLIDWPG